MDEHPLTVDDILAIHDDPVITADGMGAISYILADKKMTSGGLRPLLSSRNPS